MSQGFTTFQPSGQTHPLNTKITYSRKGDPKDKNRFEYRGTITDGSGRERTFKSPMHRWIHYVHYRQKRGGFFGGSESLYRIQPNTWTPYQVPIQEEKLPNGNILCYSYNSWKQEKRNYPKPKLLGSITAYNADKSKVLGSIRFQYPRAKHDEVAGIHVIGSDGRKASICHAGKSPIVLASSQKPNEPHISYGLHHGTLKRVSKPEGRVLLTEYNEDKKVSSQSAPVGPNDEICPIVRYEYQDQATLVYDAEDNLTIYRYNTDKKITAVEVYQDNALYRTDRFTWDTSTGNLIRKTIEGTSSLQITEYQYDKNQNPILEKIGDGHIWRTITRTFSDDGFNLKLTETDRENKLTCYTYVPNTNLLASELIYEGNMVRQRTFHFYDDCAICIKTITDDGSSKDPFNFQDATFRKITEVIPRYEQPCFGLPEVVLEKTIDPSGQEILLSKVVYTYAPFGKILQEDHFDAQNTYRYSIFNTYDDKERLISKTDPLGATTTFAYDLNNNLTTISGPKPEQYCEITYDKANRPTQIADWQTNGTILILEKKYDKLGRVIAEIDSCKNTTLFEYDSLGRVIATYYPDGGVERKEYDVLGNITKEIDLEGYETTKTYNPFGQISSAYYPNGSEEHFTYNPTGTIHSHTDTNGTTTLYTYDIFDHPISTQVSSSSDQILKTTSATWTSFHKLSETTDDLTITYTYDYAGRKIHEQKDTQNTSYFYDSLGRLKTTTQEETALIEEHDLNNQIIESRAEKSGFLQKQKKYTYDEAGNQTHIISSQGFTETVFNTDGKPLSTKDPLGFVTHYAYSYEDFFTQTTTNPKGIQTLVTYDVRGREHLRLKKNTHGETIQRSESHYNKNGNPIQLKHTIFSGTTSIKTITHSWEYGPMGRLEKFIEAGEKETNYLYDEKGRLETIVKPDGCTLMHEYDDLGRLSRYYSHDFDYQYTYDQRDRVTMVFDVISQMVTTRTYDPLSNLIQETLGNGLIFTNSYDTRGRRTQCILPDTSTIDYTYDGIFLHTVSRNGHKHTYSGHNLEGQITHALLPLGEIQIERDALGRYASLKAPYFYANYPDYDPVGNLMHYSYQDALGKVDCHYAYDDLNQLTQENAHTYDCDSLHNRLKKDTDEYTVNSLCQVTHDGQSEYIYDLCGNLISDGTRNYVYDSLDRLIAVEERDQRIEYTYDPFHRRLSKTFFVDGLKTNHIRYLWDGKREIGTADEQDHIQELRVLGEGLGAEIGAAVLYELGDKTSIPIHDHRGCVVTLIDLKTNTPIDTYRYTAFGEELTEAKNSPWRFSSKRVDEETDLVFFGRRYYHPKLGRWITQDPQGFDDGPNLYAYLHNSPLIQIDCYGLWGRQSNLSRTAFSCIEWAGAHLLPIPYVQNFVESIGRWGARAGFHGPSRYRTHKRETVIIPGKTTPGHSYTHTNGILTTREDAIKQAEYISRTHGDVQVALFYQGTNGFLGDLIGCALSKLGMPTAFNKMCANYYTSKLRDDPNHRFTSSVHSRGGIQMMNTGKLLTQEQRDHIHVRSYGSATLIPKGYFGSAINNLSPFDMVSMTNPLAYGVGLMSDRYDMHFLDPSTHCPLKEHGFLEETYAKEIRRRGHDFQKLYFKE